MRDVDLMEKELSFVKLNVVRSAYCVAYSTYYALRNTKLAFVRGLVTRQSANSDSKP